MLERNYRLVSKSNSPWKLYYLEDTPVLGNNNGFKFHVSFDPNKLHIVNSDILSILAKHSIHTFKLLSNNEDYKTDRNVQGKELVIYPRKEFGEENDPKFWIEVLNELEARLKKLEIDPNSIKPQGDKLFPGSEGYTYFRYVENIFGNYIATDFLRLYGFTNTEGFNLSDRTDFEISFSGQTLHSGVHSNNHFEERMVLSNIVMPNISTNIGRFDRTQIRDDFISNISEKNVKKIYFKNEKYNKTCVYDKEIKILEKILANLVNACVDDGNTRGDIFAKYIYDCLGEAAEYVAIIRHSVGMEVTSEMKLCIVPAFYYQCIIPLARMLKENKILTLEELKKEEEGFVRAIVKCSFREKQKQLDSIEPLYVNDLDEQILDQIIQKIFDFKKRNTDSLSSAIASRGFFSPDKCNGFPKVLPSVSFYGNIGQPDTPEVFSNSNTIA